jgi:DNA-binding HxlR family transcriptional regulator
MGKKSHGYDCPIARSLEVVGDRWTLLIIRDLLRGKRRYQELLESLAGISTNLLAERLRRLEDEGIITRRYYSDRPPRTEYVLTEKGESLGAVLDSLSQWGTAWRDLRRPMWKVREWPRRRTFLA